MMFLVCPTEILQFSAAADKFKTVKCDIIGVSVDSVYSHLSWVRDAALPPLFV
tara:strand:+ start:810 stop:968 length:159 start_codon:yes stop_codon:yes gene_type:complete